jgi:ABC-type histidine transport system ATPase subunit
MRLPTFTQVVFGASFLADMVLASGKATALSVDGRFIVDSSGKRVKLRCVNCEQKPFTSAQIVPDEKKTFTNNSQGPVRTRSKSLKA